jgi:hypothetical protein
LPGLQVYTGDEGTKPMEVLPPNSPRKHWTRRGIAEWLVAELHQGVPTLVGIDHGFSFPVEYFQEHGLAHDWLSFLEDFHRHWPTDQDVTVDQVRFGEVGNGPARLGQATWRRMTEKRCAAKSVFHFGVPGQVAKSTHAGLPWLRLIRERLGERVHVWPFDGWAIPAGVSAIAEAYPALWSKDFDREGRTEDQHDAYSIVAGLLRLVRQGKLGELLVPRLSAEELARARFEGWILGVSGYELV